MAGNSGAHLAVVLLTCCGSPPRAAPSAPPAVSAAVTAAPSLSASATTTDAGPKAPAWTSVAKWGFMYVAGVVYDAARDRYVVLSTQAGYRYGSGSVALVAPDGGVTPWLMDGEHGVKLDAPCGISIAGDTLFISDVSVVRTFDAGTGAPRAVIPIRGATRLGGMAAGGNNVYVVDEGARPISNGMGAGSSATRFTPSGTDAVYAIDKSGKVTVVMRTEKLGHPTAIAWSPHSLLLARGPIEMFVTAPVPAGLVWLESGTLRDITGTPATGLVATDDDMLAATGTAIVRVASDHVEQLAPTSAMDLGWDTKRHRLLVTHSAEVEAFERR